MNLDLSKDPLLVLLLNNIIKAASKISIQDISLNQKIDELKLAYQNVSSIDIDSLLSTINKTSKILSSYDLDNEETKSLPELIYTFKSKLDELKTRSELDNKHFISAELDEMVEQFYKMATDKDEDEEEVVEEETEENDYTAREMDNVIATLKNLSKKAEHFGDKVWIGSLKKVMKENGLGGAVPGLDNILIRAHKAGKLVLSRADLASAFTRENMISSEIKYYPTPGDSWHAVFHFVTFY